MSKLFKNTENALERSLNFFDMSNGIIPIPKEELKCSCGKIGTLHLRDIHWHTRELSPSTYRCKMGFKCVHCSRVVIFAPVIPKTMYEKVHQLTEGKKTFINWRELKSFLDSLNINYD